MIVYVGRFLEGKCLVVRLKMKAPLEGCGVQFYRKCDWVSDWWKVPLALSMSHIF